MKDKSKYRQVADKLRYQIASGELVSGGKFYTRQQLCRIYNISLMTAFHVQRCLQEDGLIVNSPGIGFFVNRPMTYMMNKQNVPIKKVKMIGSPQAIGPEAEFGSKLVDGVREVCEQNSLELDVELVQVLNNPARIINTSRRLSEDEGLIIFLHNELLPEVVNLLLNPSVRCVTMNKTFPNVAAVLPDHWHIISEILSFYRRRGIKKILYVSQFSYAIRLEKESVLFEEFKRAADGFEYETDFSGVYQTLTEHIREYKPDAVFFSDDNPALHLINHYLKDWKKKPLITGIGGSPLFEPGIEQLSGYHENPLEMGHKAVEVLLKMNENIKPPLYQYVKGHFVERD